MAKTMKTALRRDQKHRMLQLQYLCLMNTTGGFLGMMAAQGGMLPPP
jgi:hypothetical protein